MTEAEGVADPQVWQVLWQPLLTPFFCGESGEIAQVFADDTGLTFCVLYNSHIMGMKHLFLIRDISQEKPKLLFMFIVWFMGEGQFRRHPSLPRDSKQSKWRTRGDRCRVDCPLEMAEENQPADSMTAGAGPDRQCDASPGDVSVPTPAFTSWYGHAFSSSWPPNTMAA